MAAVPATRHYSLTAGEFGDHDAGHGPVGYCGGGGVEAEAEVFVALKGVNVAVVEAPETLVDAKLRVPLPVTRTLCGNTNTYVSIFIDEQIAIRPSHSQLLHRTSNYYYDKRGLTGVLSNN